MPMKVKVAGAWQTAAAKVKVAGTWKAARSWTKVSGTWRRDVQDWDLQSDSYWLKGIAWDGTYFYVVHSVGDDKVYVCDADGNHQSDRDFDLASGNTGANGIAWEWDILLRGGQRRGR